MWVRGTCATMVVPLLPVVTRRSPFSCSTRSCMFRKPSPPNGDLVPFPRANPLPLSLIRMVAPRLWPRKSIDTLVAPECLSIFVRASWAMRYKENFASGCRRFRNTTVSNSVSIPVARAEIFSQSAQGRAKTQVIQNAWSQIARYATDFLNGSV